MNEAHRNLIRERYENAVHEYAVAYCQKYGYSYDPDAWKDGVIGGVLMVNDIPIDFYAIKYNIDNDVKVTKETLGEKTDKIDFLGKDQYCGNCKHSTEMSSGNYVKCDIHGTFQKFIQTACDDYDSNNGGAR